MQLALVTETAKHLLELHHNQRSATLEWIIIILIAIEILISLVHFYDPPKVAMMEPGGDNGWTIPRIPLTASNGRT